MRLSSALLVIAAVLAVAGCSAQQKHVFVTKQGTATVETNANTGTATITTKQGTATYGKNAVDPAKLGLPVYPGAGASEGGMSVQSAQGSQQMVLLKTSDPFDKVYGWYKSQMPAGTEKMHVGAGNMSMATFAEGAPGDKQTKSVTITSENGKTSIELMSGSKSN